MLGRDIKKTFPFLHRRTPLSRERAPITVIVVLLPFYNSFLRLTTNFVMGQMCAKEEEKKVNEKNTSGSAERIKTLYKLPKLIWQRGVKQNSNFN